METVYIVYYITGSYLRQTQVDGDCFIVHYIAGSYLRQTQVDGDCLYSSLYNWFLRETDPGKWRLFI